MPKVKYRCPICDVPVLAARWEMGYNYCIKPECKVKLGIFNRIFEPPPTPDTISSVSPWELDDLAEQYYEG